MSETYAALFGVFAKSREGLARLTADSESELPSTFPRSKKWWHQQDAGVSIYAPGLVCDSHSGSALAFLGTLYNVIDQSRASEQEPQICSSKCLLKQFEMKGAAALQHLEGEFVAAFWNSRDRILLLARDQFGQRTLYFRETAHFLYFSTNLGPLLQDSYHRAELDFESAYHYLAFGLPVPGRSLAKGIKVLPAAHYLLCHPASIPLVCRYFTPLSYNVKKVVTELDLLEMERSLDRGISARVVPHRQALLLSGGVDSSYIGITAATQTGGEQIDAYTVDFGEQYTNNEKDYARLAAEKAGMRHMVIDFGIDDALSTLRQILNSEVPCSAWACLTHEKLLSRIQADGHTQLLSGLGADEVFGGYWKYFQHYASLRRFMEKWPIAEQVDSIDGILWDTRQARNRLFAGVPRFFDEEAVRHGLGKPYNAWNFSPWLIAFYRECRSLKPEAHLFEMMVAHEVQNRIPDLLFAGFEPIARSHGVRCAYPFLNKRTVVEACGLGASERFWLQDGRWKNKRVLRQIAAKKLPQSIMARTPVSYTTPILLWLQDERFFEEIFGCLLESTFIKTGLVQRRWIERVVLETRRQFTQPNKVGFRFVEQLWALATLAAWYDRWIARLPGEVS